MFYGPLQSTLKEIHEGPFTGMIVWFVKHHVKNLGIMNDLH